MPAQTMGWLRRLIAIKAGDTKAGLARTGPLTPREAAAVAALHAEGGFARAWDTGECAALLADPAIVAEAVFPGSSSRPSGFVLSRRVLDEAEILSVVTARGQRKAGLGRALMGAHLSRLSALGTATLFLEVEEGNAAALALYRRFGFSEIGRRHGYYRKTDGSRATALTMRLSL